MYDPHGDQKHIINFVALMLLNILCAYVQIQIMYTEYTTLLNMSEKFDYACAAIESYRHRRQLNL